jgi:hypothetical protein
LPTKENKFPFSVRRKQMESCRFNFPFEAKKLKLPFSVSSVFRLYIYTCTYTDTYICTYTHVHTHTHYIYTYIHIYIYAGFSNGKWKPMRFSLIHLPFAHHTNGSWSFVR